MNLTPETRAALERYRAYKYSDTLHPSPILVFADCRDLADAMLNIFPADEPAPLSAWSDDPPTREGWYWHRTSSFNVNMVRINSLEHASTDDGLSYIVPSALGGQWQPVEGPKP